MIDKIDKIRDIFLFPWRPLINYCIKNQKKWYVKQIPNLISLVRIILIFPLYHLFVGGLSKGNTTEILIAIIVGVIIGSGDAADGEIARESNSQSVLGKLLDPFADKFFFLAAALGLWNLIKEPVNNLTKFIFLLGIILIFSEFILFLLGIAALVFSKYIKEIKLGSNIFGKIKFTFECFLLLGALVLIFLEKLKIYNTYIALYIFVFIFLNCSIIFAIFSILNHLKSFFKK